MTDDYDYQRLWNVLMNTLVSTIEIDKTKEDREFNDALYGLIDATRNKL